MSPFETLVDKTECKSDIKCKCGSALCRGYLAPEYAHLGQLSEKVDVFSFGVLLLEIVSRRRNIGPIGPEGQLYLPDWVSFLLTLTLTLRALTADDLCLKTTPGIAWVHHIIKRL